MMGPALQVLDGGSNLLKDAKNKLDRTKDPKEAKLLRMVKANSL